MLNTSNAHHESQRCEEEAHDQLGVGSMAHYQTNPLTE